MSEQLQQELSGTQNDRRMGACMISPEELQARILYRDAMMLILDKPVGMAVHASGRNDHHLGLYLDSLRFGLPNMPELAHRLDRDTSGCLVLGRHRKALARLGTLFADGLAKKTYWAVVVGYPGKDEGVVALPLSKKERKYGWRVQIDPSGQEAETRWRVLGRSERLSFMECQPITGRTHQIRVHLASMGCPIVGDRIYGQGVADILTPFLHLVSRHIELPYYPNKAPISATAPISPKLIKLFSLAGMLPEDSHAAQEEQTKKQGE